jgi:hypothetical protein
MRRESLWFWLPLIGIAVHCAFLVLLRPAFDADWRRQWERAETEADLELLSEPEIAWELTKLSVLPCVYGPAIFISVAINGYRLLKQHETRFWSSLCIVWGLRLQYIWF